MANMNDEESSALTSNQLQSRNLRRKKRNQLIATVVICVLIVTSISVTLDYTVFRFTAPSYQLSSVRISNLNNSSSSFSIEFDANIAMKNRNFAPYKYEWEYLTFSYEGIEVGHTIVERSEVKRRSSKSMSVTLNITSHRVTKNGNLRRDIDSGRLAFSVESELRGQVEMMKIIRKDKVVVLDCSLTVDLGAKAVQELACN